MLVCVLVIGSFVADLVRVIVNTDKIVHLRHRLPFLGEH